MIAGYTRLYLTLEDNFTGKKLVFVKELGESICREFETRLGKVPMGFPNAV